MILPSDKPRRRYRPWILFFSLALLAMPINNYFHILVVNSFTVRAAPTSADIDGVCVTLRGIGTVSILAVDFDPPIRALCVYDAKMKYLGEIHSNGVYLLPRSKRP